MKYSDNPDEYIRKCGEETARRLEEQDMARWDRAVAPLYSKTVEYPEEARFEWTPETEAAYLMDKKHLDDVAEDSMRINEFYGGITTPRRRLRK